MTHFSEDDDITDDDTDDEHLQQISSISNDNNASVCCCASMSCWKTCWRRYNREMKPRDTLRMTAFEKWKYYRRPPWKLFLNILLVVMTTAQVLLTNERLSAYTQASNDNFEYLLAPIDADPYATHQVGFDSIHYLYETDKFISTLNYSTFVYFHVNNITVDHYQYVNEPTPPMLLSVTEYVQGVDVFDEDIKFNGKTKQNEYHLSHAYDLGPFDGLSNDELFNYVHSLREVKVVFSLQNFDLDSDVRVCFQWKNIIVYDFAVRGRIAMQIDSKSSFCPQDANRPWYSGEFSFQIWIFMSVAILATLSELLILKSIFKQISIFSAVRSYNIKNKKPQYNINDNQHNNNNENDVVTWDELQWHDKLSFFNIWYIFAAISNVCNIIGPLVGIHEYLVVNSVEFSAFAGAFIGLGCLLAWITLVQYVEGFASYYVLITTLRKSLPRVAQFMVGVLPVFVGYALFGVAFFGLHSTYFEDLDSACVTLFALLNGDSIHDVFMDVGGTNDFVSRIYLYSFVSLFIYAVLNIFIAIVEDAFFATKAFQLHSDSQFEPQTMDFQPPSTPDNRGVNRTPSFDRQKSNNLNIQNNNPNNNQNQKNISINNDNSKKSDRRSSKWSKDDSQILNFVDFSPIRGARPALPRTPSGRSYIPKQQSSKVVVTRIPSTGEEQQHVSRRVLSPSGNTNTSIQGVDIMPELTLSQTANPLFITLSTLQQQTQNEFKQQLSTFINKLPSDITPPHMEQFFPCSNKQCLYCSIRRDLEELLSDTQMKMRNVLYKAERERKNQS